MMKAQLELLLQSAVDFNLKEEFCKHGWKGHLSSHNAEQILKGKSPFSYLIRLGEEKSKFTLSYVRADGAIQHVHFVLVDWVYGIFQNGGPFKATLDVLIRYKMNCTESQACPV